jgi:hypothetical protein
MKEEKRMKFRLTGQYGELSPVRNWQSHSGIDFGMAEGTTLRSITKGTVRLADYGNQNAGKTVLIDSPDGYTYIYGHCHDFVAKNGQYVHSGDIIAHSGNTGHSTSSHLHFGMKDTATGQFQDPTYLAEKVSNYAGSDFTLTPGMGVIPKLFGLSSEAIKEHAKEITIDILCGVGEALAELLASVTLVGAGLCVILRVCGWRDGGRWCGILIGVNVLLKFLEVRI